MKDEEPVVIGDYVKNHMLDQEKSELCKAFYNG
jgi:hypothetical protein